MSKLPLAFYQSDDVVQVARALLGKVLVTNINGQITSGYISETEAYCGATDKASHAYNGKRTKRTETMFQAGGRAYVYLCYGIHNMFNVVTNIEGKADAVLIRGIKPLDGIATMLFRRKQVKVTAKLSAGPGTLGKALGITRDHDGVDLRGDQIWIEDGGIVVPDDEVVIGPRIGIDYAAEDALLPWRFVCSFSTSSLWVNK